MDTRKLCRQASESLAFGKRLGKVPEANGRRRGGFLECSITVSVSSDYGTDESDTW